MESKIFSLLAFFLIFFNCSKSQISDDTTIEIDKTIKKDTVFGYLSRNNQKFIIKEPYDQNKKRTVFIDYYKKECNVCRDFNELYEYYQAKAIFDKDNSLNIKISVEEGLSGSGFFIKCKNKKFKVLLHTFDDQSGTKFSNCRILHQNLVLNKANFVVGDSIYGKINFEILENSEFRGEIKHKFQGYFVTKISEKWN
ncbi:MAG: hypothetical protein DI622_04985 [Chryseobacterium sp.]|uniref:hypothetical protein n=1 Tax=Chryseobacterium sp. TaxID=1871047 RepID=UPI000DB501E1|nr:hypothetical protein [Chryseobacterium sp.]MPS64002.1 hypothetical protein [Chryseobacterium sp.]PZU23369.1 MAG: hypothetical protein DI622_04985 [Chryseobacterium sp.]